MKHSTKIHHLSELIRRCRAQVGLPYGLITELWGFGSAFRGDGACGDIDVVVQIKHLKTEGDWNGYRFINSDKVKSALRRNMRGIEFHPSHDVDFAAITPILLFHHQGERPIWREHVEAIR